MSKEFNKALSNFTHDMASGGAIRHLSDLGYNVYEIKERLDFPTPMERIISTVWNHYLETGIIRTETPTEDAFIEKVDYITVYDDYGKPSFKRVVTREETVKRDYLKVEYGLMKYKDIKAYDAFLSSLSKSSMDLIEPMPWPLTPVFIDRKHFGI